MMSECKTLYNLGNDWRGWRLMALDNDDGGGTKWMTLKCNRVSFFSSN